MEIKRKEDKVYERDEHLFQLREKFRIAYVDEKAGLELSKSDLKLLTELITDYV